MKNQRILYLIERYKERMLTIVILIEVWNSKLDKDWRRWSEILRCTLKYLKSSEDMLTG